MKKATILLTLLLAFTINCFAADDVKLHREELKGSIILIAEPDVWNKNVLILAHGYREPELPLTADFEYDNIFFRTLVADGWIVASTSYRINGIAYVEGLEDVGILKDFVIENYGKPEHIFLQGESMGGSISITISEKYYEGYSGALCIDPAIQEKLRLTRNPQIPVLFLCNQNEADQVNGYLAKLDKNAVPPAQWIVKRDGHVNVNPEERQEAFAALVDYAGGKPIAMKRDILIIPKDKPTSALFKDGGLYTKITRVHPKYGNLDTEIIPADFEKLGIKKEDKFRVQFGNNKAEVLFGTTFGDVPKGEWVAFFKEDGLLKIARNFDSAVKVLKCKEEDFLFISKMP